MIEGFGMVVVSVLLMIFSLLSAVHGTELFALALVSFLFGALFSFINSRS